MREKNLVIIDRSYPCLLIPGVGLSKEPGAGREVYCLGGANGCADDDEDAVAVAAGAKDGRRPSAT